MLYELLYLIPARLTDEEAGAVETKVSAVLTKYGATVESVKRLGKLRLAYPIKREHYGYYVLVHFSSETNALAKIEEALRITADVMRFLVLHADEVGMDQKYDLVEFAEVNIETKEDRARRRDRREMKPKDHMAEGLKEGVAAMAAEPEPFSTPKPTMSIEELEKKIETALSEDVESV